MTNLQPPPDGVSMLIGDTAHAARSCLDHLAWALATNPDEHTTFPICETGTDKNGAQIRPSIPGGVRSKKCRDLLYQVQPYYGGKDPAFSPLVWLKKLDNVDKHRFVVAAAASHSESHHGVPEALFHSMFPTWGMLVDGQEVNRFFFTVDDHAIPHGKVRDDQVIPHPLDQGFPHPVLR